jgi:hypothetical protein
MSEEIAFWFPNLSLAVVGKSSTVEAELQHKRSSNKSETRIHQLRTLIVMPQPKPWQLRSLHRE